MSSNPARDLVLAPAVVHRLFGAPEAPGRRLEGLLRPLDLHIGPQPQGVRVRGDAPAIRLALQIIEEAAKQLTDGGAIEDARLRQITAETVAHGLKHDLAYRLPGLPHAVRPMSLSQVAFMEALLFSERSIVFGVGPTGTGKTHLAVAAGLNLVAEGRFKSLVLTRPHVMLEGEIMTPASRAETAADDQLTPLEDVLQELIGHDELARRIEHGQVQILPLGRLRGRTFNESFVIIDEAQNLTVKKMRMAVTRLGRASKMAIIGDPNQIDLTGDEPSGLTHLLAMLEGKDIADIRHFDVGEIIRNDVVARIEALYAAGGAPPARAAA